jgi:hypothetical protein
VLTCAIALLPASLAQAQNNDNNNDNNNYNRAVGGVSIDARGLLQSASVDALGTLSKMRREAMENIPAAMKGAAQERKISLAQLEATVAECLRDGKPLPNSIKYLAGLQRIQYIFVYPEKKDIVLVGSGEGWKVDAKGNVVGVTTGRPVMQLDDLLVAMRTARDAAQGGITCSIDPTPEGMARLNQMAPVHVQGADEAQAVANERAKVLGMQRISVRGVPENSHFARVLVAADYRMKRLAMNFEPSPVRGLPSYLQMTPASARSVQTPRFWLEPKYDALLRDADGTAFELCGAGVKAMTEEDFFNAAGNVKHSGKASPLAQKWADMMTEKYAELATADPIFGELQNCMDLAVIGALVVREQLMEKANLSLPTLMDADKLPTQVFNPAKIVESQGSVLRKGKSWIISTSGGVAINSWGIVEKLREGESAGKLRDKAVPAAAEWWWN